MEYTCPMHPEIKKTVPGKCPKCGMRLVDVKNSRSRENSTSDSYVPLFTIVALIVVVTAALAYRDFQSGNFIIPSVLSYFMTGFFLVFAGFKLISLREFAEGYSTYDLLAKRVFAYGYIYPFIELFFGLAMILMPFSRELLVAEFLVMSFSGIGVVVKLAKKEKFRCVCLGTVLKVPLTKVTLVEDFGMAALALVLLVM